MGDMKKKERKVNIIMAVIMSAVMGLLFAFIARMTADPQQLKNMPPVPVMIITSLLESITIGIIVALIIPMGRMGRSLAAKAGARPGSMKFNALNSIPFAVINGVILSAICSFINIAQAHAKMPADKADPLFKMWFSNWIVTLPLSIIVGYILALIISPIVVRKVGLGGPPQGAGIPQGGGGNPPVYGNVPPTGEDGSQR